MSQADLDVLSASGQEQVGLAEVLDRLVEQGVALQGDLAISVADVDLIWVGLKAVIGTFDIAPPGLRLDGARSAALEPMSSTAPRLSSASRSSSASDPAPARRGSPRPGGRAALPRHDRVRLEPERLEEGLVRLVMSVVELLRQLVERQAIRRVDDPRLSEEQVERLGLALARLDERMTQLKEFFDLTDEDLELGLVGLETAS